MWDKEDEQHLAPFESYKEWNKAVEERIREMDDNDGLFEKWFRKHWVGLMVILFAIGLFLKLFDAEKLDDYFIIAGGVVYGAMVWDEYNKNKERVRIKTDLLAEDYFIEKGRTQYKGEK